MIEANPDEIRRANSSRRVSALADLLVEGGFDVDFLTYSSSGDIRKALCRSMPDIVWSQSQRCQGNGTDRLNVHALLEEESFPYVGSPPEVLDMLRSKAALKERWGEAGIRTPPAVAFSRGADGLCLGLERILELDKFPYIVKPQAEGNSRGIGEASVAYDRGSLHAAIERVLNSYGGGLTEEYLYRYPDAREFTVALVGDGPGRRLMPAELVRAGGPRGAITSEDKLRDRVFARPVADIALKRSILSFAAAAFDAAGPRGYARLDLFLADGSFHALEINGQPMVPDPWFDACAAGDGLDPRSYPGIIVRSGLARSGAAGLRAG